MAAMVGAAPDFLVDGPDDGPVIVLAHGAGAAMDSPFMAAFAAGHGHAGLRCVRFEFPFMAARRTTGKRPGPDRAPVLIETWHRVVGALGPPGRLVIGGKSLGGRMASLVADELGVAGLVCLGYPFHPVAKPERTRTEHLAGIQTPTLIVQGERDALGARAEVGGYRLAPAIRLHWLADGDHGFKPRKRSGFSEAGNWADGIAEVADFVTALIKWT